MRELNTILAAINISVLDDEVIKRAILMAKETKAQLHFIHAIDIAILDIEITSEFLKQKIDEEGIKKKISQKIDMLNEGKDIQYILHVSVGDADEQIIYKAKKIRADLIILGTYSNTNNIAQKSGLPILVIKNSVNGTYKNILAPTDFSNSSKKSILFTQLAFKSPTIELVHIYQELDDLAIEYSELDSDKDSDESVFLGRPLANIFKKEVGIQKIEMIKSSLSINESLLEYIKAKKNELLVLGSSGSDIAGSFLGSSAIYLLENTQSDILIYIPLNQEEK